MLLQLHCFPVALSVNLSSGCPLLWNEHLDTSQCSFVSTWSGLTLNEFWRPTDKPSGPASFDLVQEGVMTEPMFYLRLSLLLFVFPFSVSIYLSLPSSSSSVLSSFAFSTLLIQKQSVAGTNEIDEIFQDSRKTLNIRIPNSLS